MDKRTLDIFAPTVAVAALLLLWYKRMMIALPGEAAAAFLAGCGIGFVACGVLLDFLRRASGKPGNGAGARLDNKRIVVAGALGAAFFALACLVLPAPFARAGCGALAGFFAACAFLASFASGLRALSRSWRGRAFAAVFFCAGLVNTTCDLAELPALRVAGDANFAMAALCALVAAGAALAKGRVFNARVQAVADEPAATPALMARLGLLAIACFVLMYVAVSLKDVVAYPVAVESITPSGFIRYVELPMWVVAGFACDLAGRRPLLVFCTLCAFVGSAGLLAPAGSASAALCTLCSYFCLIGFPCACVCLVVDISVYLPRPAFAGAFCFAPILAGAAVGALADALAQGAGNDVLFIASTACLALFAGAGTLLMRDAAPVAHALANATPVITMPGEDARLSPDGIARRYGLTAREQEVLALALRGLTVAQMADDLVVSKSTVKFHITNVLKKTGFESREQMIQKLAEDASPPRS